MFHILGRCVLTSSFSRRSNPGLLTGSTGCEFLFCEKGPLCVFIISTPIHPLFAIQIRHLTARSTNPASIYAMVRGGSPQRGIWSCLRPIHMLSPGPMPGLKLGPRSRQMIEPMSSIICMTPMLLSFIQQPGRGSPGSGRHYPIWDNRRYLRRSRLGCSTDGVSR